MATDRPPLTITINGISYPCSSWQTSSAARTLERRYDSGFNGGMGFFTEKQITGPNQIYNCVNLDPSTFPYLRMRKGERDQTVLTLTNSDTTFPAYGFVEEDAGGVEYLYIVNGARSFKIDLGDNGGGIPALEATTQPTGFSGGEVGRPVRFEGTWYVPLGDGSGNPNARKLTTVGVGDQANDTWADVGVKARHFAKMMTEDAGAAIAQMWRAHSTNVVSVSADGSSFSGTSEVGDSSFGITDMLNVSGEIMVFKPDAPYRLDSQGISKAVMEFVGATGGYLTNFTGNDGANSGVFGPYAYWAHTSGLWRIWGDSAVTIGPSAPANWTPINLDSMTPASQGWVGFSAWGRWAYALNRNTGLHVGWVESDGTVRWMGNILSGAETDWDAEARMGIATTSVRPILWMVDVNDRFAIFDLELDGSMRLLRPDGGASSERGKDGEIGQAWMPNTDLGEPEKQKQMRMAWLTVDNNAYPNVDISMRIHRDRAVTSEQIGSAITSADGDGKFEFVFTPGTSDTFNEAMLAVRMDTTDASVTLTDTSIAFVDGGGGADTITDSNSGFGIFSAGENITVTGDSDNNGVYTIVSVVAGTITLATGSLPNAPEGAGDSVTITRTFRADNADVRIRAIGWRAVTPHTYTAIIPVDKDRITGSLGVKDAKIKLEALKSSEGVPVTEPGFNAPFTGYIKDVQLKVIDAQDGAVDYAIEVTIDRWVL